LNAVKMARDGPGARSNVVKEGDGPMFGGGGCGEQQLAAGKQLGRLG
jgi:hypothetical protein